MTHHMSRRETALPFTHPSIDPYWRRAPMYKAGLMAMHRDIADNYTGGAIDATGEARTERTALLDLIHAAAHDIDDLMIPFVTQERQYNAPLMLSPCYPYSARHYANIVWDMHDYAVASLAEPSPENVTAYGCLPALLANLAQNLSALVAFERRPPLTPQRRVAMESPNVAR